MGVRLLKGPVEIKLPADKSMMLVIRLAAAGIAARTGMGVDRMEDIKMAVEEACTCLISENNDAELRLCFRETDEELIIDIRGCGECADDAEIDVIKCILASLVDHVEMHIENRRIESVQLRIGLGLSGD